MYQKAYNLFVKISIVILLVLGLLLVISGSLKSAGLIDKPEVFLMLSVFLRSIEFGSITDWISSGCNVVMAYAAYKAFSLAKDYFTDVIKKDGYELVKKLQIELIPELARNISLSSLNNISRDVPAYINGELGIFQREGEDSDLNRTLNTDLKQLHKKINIAHNLSFEITTTLNKLETYGWEMKPHKKEKLLNALNVNEQLFTLVQNVAVYLSEIMRRDENNFLPDLSNPNFENYNSDTPNAPPAVLEIEQLVEKVIYFQKLIYNPNESTLYGEAQKSFNLYFSDSKHLKNFFRYSSD